MKRINYNNGYLYCSISDISELKTEGFTFEDYKQDIIDECMERGYNEDETQAVLWYYQIFFDN